MGVRIQFEAANAAFSENPTAETARVLRKLADDIEASGERDQYRPLRDMNGNRIGEAEIHLND